MKAATVAFLFLGDLTLRLAARRLAVAGVDACRALPPVSFKPHGALRVGRVRARVEDGLTV